MLRAGENDGPRLRKFMALDEMLVSPITVTLVCRVWSSAWVSLKGWSVGKLRSWTPEFPWLGPKSIQILSAKVELEMHDAFSPSRYPPLPSCSLFYGHWGTSLDHIPHCKSSLDNAYNASSKTGSVVNLFSRPLATLIGFPENVFGSPHVTRNRSNPEMFDDHGSYGCLGLRRENTPRSPEAPSWTSRYYPAHDTKLASMDGGVGAGAYLWVHKVQILRLFQDNQAYSPSFNGQWIIYCKGLLLRDCGNLPYKIKAQICLLKKDNK